MFTAEKGKPLRVVVSFACNDERGNLTERVESVAVGMDAVTLAGPPLAYREGAKVQVGRRRFAHHGMSDWVGNWCWNGAMMDVAEARRLVAYLLERGWCAESWQTKGPFADLFGDDGRAPRRAG